MLYSKVTLKVELNNSEASKIARFIQKIGKLSDEFGCDESWEIKEVD